MVRVKKLLAVYFYIRWIYLNELIIIFNFWFTQAQVFSRSWPLLLTASMLLTMLGIIELKDFL